MKFLCFTNTHLQPMFPHFDSKAEALEHLRQFPSHKVMTAHYYSGMSFGKLCPCGAVVKEEYFKEHKCNE